MFKKEGRGLQEIVCRQILHRAVNQIAWLNVLSEDDFINMQVDIFCFLLFSLFQKRDGMKQENSSYTVSL